VDSVAILFPDVPLRQRAGVEVEGIRQAYSSRISYTSAELVALG